jgi:hypothetical protein
MPTQNFIALSPFASREEYQESRCKAGADLPSQYCPV